MNQINDFFLENPLPFTYMSFPYLDDQPKPRHPTHLFYVNQTIAELTLRFFNRSGLPHIKIENEGKNPLSWGSWNISWGQQFDPPEYRLCTAWQKINHFAGSFYLGRKAELHQRMTELAQRTGQEHVDFYPLSFMTPSELPRLIKKWKDVKYWIKKPSSAARGEGIHVVSSSESPSPLEKDDDTQYVIQEFIERPLLINGLHKFDVRLYALVTSVAPLRIYLHECGLARIATHDYFSNSSNSIDVNDLAAMLTNVSLNRNEEGFSVSQQKIPLSQLYDILRKQGINTDLIVKDFERIVTFTIISAASKIRQYHQSLVPHRQTSFEMFGFDILIDEKLKCWLMEVNISPSMSGKDAEFDRNQKYNIMAEMYDIGRVIYCDPSSVKVSSDGQEKFVLSQNDSRTRKAVELYDDYWRDSIKSINMKVNPTPWDWSRPIFADIVAVRDFIEEKGRLRKFKKVFPRRKNIDDCVKCFEKLGYLDRSFFTWIKMSNEERLNALKRGEQTYLNGLKEIEQKLNHL
ncbi:hypothetical protein M9Y10_005712 [Tritrichomonas musculus]|uniref:Tubulin--tyrosine ligase-like protein 5 n=1 Tax=Tritrichomonas musculus TaxID=1915356 RepID=A0ABR2JF48_9EUKA